HKIRHNRSTDKILLLWGHHTMVGSLHDMVIDTQEKLGRALKEEEIAFIKWMVEKQMEEDKEREIQHHRLETWTFKQKALDNSSALPTQFWSTSAIQSFLCAHL